MKKVDEIGYCNLCEKKQPLRCGGVGIQILKVKKFKTKLLRLTMTRPKQEAKPARSELSPNQYHF